MQGNMRVRAYNIFSTSNARVRRTRMRASCSIADMSAGKDTDNLSRKLVGSERLYLTNVSRIQYHGMKWNLDQEESGLDAMAKVLKDAERNGHVGWLVDHYWTAVLRRGGERIQQALAPLDKMPGDYQLYTSPGQVSFFTEMGERQIEPLFECVLAAIECQNPAVRNAAKPPVFGPRIVSQPAAVSTSEAVHERPRLRR